MRELTFQNGRPTDAPKVRLDCTECGGYTTFDRESDSVVRCTGCGKRHSTDSLVDTNTPLAEG